MCNNVSKRVLADKTSHAHTTVSLFIFNTRKRKKMRNFVEQNRINLQVRQFSCTHHTVDYTIASAVLYSVYACLVGSTVLQRNH